MKKHLLIALVLVVAAGLSACDTMDKDWEKAISSGTPDALRTYLAAHPEGENAKIAKYHLERSLFRYALENNNLEAYDAYLKEFPKGKYAAKMKEQRSAIFAERAGRLTVDAMAAARIRVETDKGPFTIRLFPDKAPATSRNFLTLAASGFYDGLIFHQTEPKKFIQAGDPRGDGIGGPGYFIPFENNDLKNTRGKVVMWHMPVDPNTAGSQFFICLSDLPERDGKFTVFGEVVDGMTVADAIAPALPPAAAGSAPPEPADPAKIVRVVIEGINIK